MIASTSHQDWLFYFPLAQQAELLKDDLLDPVDQLLEDPPRRSYAIEAGRGHRLFGRPRDRDPLPDRDPNVLLAHVTRWRAGNA